MRRGTGTFNAKTEESQTHHLQCSRRTKYRKCQGANHDAKQRYGLRKRDITPRYLFKDRRKANNLVTEVNSMMIMKFLGKKMKLGGNMCNVEDYIKIIKCYKCSKFNHRAQDCKGELNCPLCTGSHTLRECNATKEQYKCINCSNFNKYNQQSPVNEKHSYLDNSRSCYQHMVRRHTETIDY